jgi:hypothetical protein
MNFELKSVSLAQVAEWDVDALLVLCADEVLAASRHAQDPVSVWVQSAIAAGDLEPGAAKLLQSYALAGVTARRLVFARAGDGSAAQARKAAAAAMGAIKGAKVGKLGVYAGSLGVAAVNAVVQAVADASYVYTATKSKGEGRSIRHVDVGVTDAGAVRSGFELGCATVRGVELAREWANRPANHATPTLLAEAAQQLARKSRLSCEVLGPEQVAELGMGAFMAVAQGSGAAAALHRAEVSGRSQGRGAGGAGGQGHHLRYRRHLDQAGRRDGRDEVRHGWRGQRAGHLRRAGRVQAGAQRGGPDPGLREHAQRPCGQAGRCGDQHERPDHRGAQHRRRGPSHPVRRADLCAAL